MVEWDITDIGTAMVELTLEDGSTIVVKYDHDADCMRVTGTSHRASEGTAGGTLPFPGSESLGFTYGPVTFPAAGTRFPERDAE